MDFDQLRQILELVREHELSEFEIEQEGLRLKIRKDSAGVVPRPAPPPGAAPSASGGEVGEPGSGPAVAEVAGGDEGVELAVVKSPIVGTFYRAAEPGASSFVEVGSLVTKGQVLCIIEAMKLMNEIDSEYEGEIVSIYVENGHAVQYGERLFAIRTK
jgi:acetyl-CoA carboxylase biotin carboxyl carrier protein